MNTLQHMECQLIIDSLPLAICTLDKAGIVRYTNQAFISNMGGGVRKELEKGPGDLMACANSFSAPNGCGSGEACQVCKLRHYINTVISGNAKADYIEMPFMLIRDGVEVKRWFEIHIIPDLLEKKNLILVTFQDITFYKRSSLKLLQNQRIAEETTRAKSMFLANMSHEIRTPLNGMIGMLELTLAGGLDEEQRENLEVAKNCADTLLALINDILDISKIDDKKLVLEETKFDLRDLVHKVTEIHRPRMEEKNLEMICNVEESIPEFIKGDPLRLQQVLNNLVSNAVKFTERGSVQLEVKVLCQSADSYTITFTVEDTGIGIQQKDMKQLFQLFNQVDGSFARKYGGTGLGLNISQRLVNLMGGEIKVKSQKDKGSLFYFTIQMKKADTADNEKEIQVCSVHTKHPDRILIVEDDKTNMLVIRKLLEQLGYTDIEEAEDGYEAIKCIEKETFDIILMDIQLPQMDGLETTQIIREKEKHSGRYTPIIAITAFALEGDKEHFLAKGMDGYVSKPVNLGLLQKELERFPAKKLPEKTQKERSTLEQVYAQWGYSGAGTEKNRSISSRDREAFATALKELRNSAEEARKDKAYWALTERKAHDLKIMAKKKENKRIENGAFRIELAARIADYEAVIKRCADLEKAVNE